jgi:hypothetical protein
MKMCNIIFLDIDGVLNSEYWNENHKIEIDKGCLIDESKVELLAELVEYTKAKIVLHSGWRFWFDDKLQPLRKEAADLTAMFMKYKICIAEKTPDLTTEEIRATRKFSKVKAEEILLWIDKNYKISKWIVLDDLELNNALVREHQIKTDASMLLNVQNEVEMLLNI